MEGKEKERTGANAVLWFILSLFITVITSTFMPRLMRKSASRAHKRSKMRYLDK